MNFNSFRCRSNHFIKGEVPSHASQIQHHLDPAQPFDKCLNLNNEVASESLKKAKTNDFDD